MVNKTSNRIMNLEDRAREYAEGKSSASVFRDAHIRDFKAGYNQALKDTRFDEMLEMLKSFVDNNMLSVVGEEMAVKLIEEATEL